MGYHEVCLNEFQQRRKWLHEVQPELFKLWVKETRHKAGANAGTLACQLRPPGNGNHLSLPCSLLQEANEIGTFLASPALNDYPVTFIRLFIFLLDEFTERLRQVAEKECLGLPLGKQPRGISIWANNWAKHRTQILLQHHPCIMFLDRMLMTGTECKQRTEAEGMQDQCGETHPCRVFDQDSLGSLSDGSFDPKEAVAVMVVPPLKDLLVEAIEYFKKFVSLARADRTKLERLESERFQYGCFNSPRSAQAGRGRSTPSRMQATNAVARAQIAAPADAAQQSDAATK